MVSWWAWVVAGLALGVVELLAPAYIFLGFALGAVATGGLIWLGLLVGTFPASFAAFAVLSLIAWLGLRMTLGKRSGDVRIVTKDINEG